MGWDPNPWMVAGARHSAEVCRMLAYMATEGREGIIAPGHLKVVQRAVPSGGVRILTGGCGILARWTTFQLYAGRMTSEDDTAIAATAPGVTRSDLVIARVEDPADAAGGWPVPADPLLGPYIFTRVLQGVPATTKRLSDVQPTQSGIALARIDIPAATATITDAMIKPLAPLIGGTEFDSDSSNATPFIAEAHFSNAKAPSVASTLLGNENAYKDWPTDASWTVPVPSWATHMDIRFIAWNAGYAGGDSWGRVKMVIGGIDQWESPFDNNQQTGELNAVTFHLPAVRGDVPVLDAWKGKLVQFKIRGRSENNTLPGWVAVGTNSTLELTIDFKRRP